MKYYVCDLCRKTVDKALECKLPVWFSSVNEETKVIEEVKFKIDSIAADICEDCSTAMADYIYEKIVAVNPPAEAVQAAKEVLEAQEVKEG